MAPLSLLLLLPLLHSTICSAQPSPGYYPSSMQNPQRFYQGFTPQWGTSHQYIPQDQSSITLWLDATSGSGFKSSHSFRNGYFGVSLKLQRGYTAGVNTAFYLSNGEAHPGFHDEIDMEFLGTVPGEQYTLQTNVYVRGSGDGRVLGREMKFHLWFDPTTDYHRYAILWNPDQILFFVDDIPIRRYERKNEAIFPNRPLWVYGSIWDASSWATDNGRYKADYRYQPFQARFSEFLLGGCSTEASSSCSPVRSSPSGAGISSGQMAAMQWAQRNYMVYYYCSDSSRDHTSTPECMA